MRAVFFSIAFSFLQTSAFAESTPVAQSQSEISITKPTYQHTLQLGFIKKFLVATAEYSPENDTIRYEPNTPSSVSLGYSNRTLGIAFSAALGKSHTEESEKKRIQSTDHDYQFRYFNNNFGLELIYQDYRGFEAIADNNTDAALMSDAEKFQPDLKMKTYAIQLDWAFKGISTLEAFGAAWEKPKSDGAGYYLLSSLTHTEFSSPHPFYPQQIPTIVEDRGLYSGKHLTLATGMGASYIYQWSRFYMAGFLSVQAGPQLQQYERTNAGDTDEVKFAWFPSLKAVMGYDFGNYYFNLVAHTHGMRAEIDDTVLSTASQEVGFYGGGRF